MASLRSGQGCSPAEALQTSQGETSNNARRTSWIHGSSVWHMVTWNVRTLVDIEGFGHKDLLPLRGKRDLLTAVKQQDRTGVCGCLSIVA